MKEAVRSIFEPGADTYPYSRDRLTAAVTLLLDAAAKSDAIRRDVDPQDVLLAVAASTWAFANDSDWQERARPVLRLVMDVPPLQAGMIVPAEGSATQRRQRLSACGETPKNGRYPLFIDGDMRKGSVSSTCTWTYRGASAGSWVNPGSAVAANREPHRCGAPRAVRRFAATTIDSL